MQGHKQPDEASSTHSKLVGGAHREVQPFRYGDAQRGGTGGSVLKLATAPEAAPMRKQMAAQM